MVSHHWRGGYGDWWKGHPRPEARQAGKGWDQAEMDGQEGPLGLFNVWRRTYPTGAAMKREWVGQVIANNCRDAQKFARRMYPNTDGLLDAWRQDRDPNNKPKIVVAR